MLPPMPSVEYLDVWLQWRLNRIEIHEAREHLRRDGKPVFDPHREYGDRDEWPPLLTSAGLKTIDEAARRFVQRFRAAIRDED
jgi:hypothetical protein